MVRIAVCLLALTLLGCGREADDGEEIPTTESAATPYGSAAEVTEYLMAMRPFIRDIGAIQTEVETALSSVTGAGGERQGTGRNLAAAAGNARPRLEGLLGDFEQLAPPALMAPLHRDVVKLMKVRLAAYENMQDGWSVEQSGGEFRPLYKEAEEKLRQANVLITDLNDSLTSVNTSLQKVASESAPPTG